ncbi:MAG: radical SAM family heme chaperone HemW, partial [Lachnospiraceae bacterium]|nr:radical SAM family heme chaperone HemW [Lachnospiraceae bacterium]
MTSDLGIYIHIPFCVKKCNYCDFLSFSSDRIKNSFEDENDIHKRYIEALKKEALDYSKKVEGRYIKTIYIGGGTPSILDEYLISDLLEFLQDSFNIRDDAEITIECNPKTTNYKKLKKYYDSGINRLSLGLQSTNNELLKKLGRIHTYEEFLTQYDEALNAGFTNINVDLMSALPGESIDDYIKDLRNVINLKTKHISSYGLIIEENTPFYSNENILKNLPSEEEAIRMYELTNEYLENAGYNRYEISNYSVKGYESKHNQSYWTLDEYIGLGLYASSYLDNKRYKVHKDLAAYMENDYHKIEVEELSVNDSMEEFMFLGLRMMKGVSYNDFYEKFNCSIDDVYHTAISKNIKLNNL